jgi:hypothetical protein
MIFPTISIMQPWAWAILHAGKDVENRTWAPPRRFTGVFSLIHAGKKIDREAVIHLLHLGYKVPERLETGGIVGVTKFLWNHDTEPSPWAEPGLQHWYMSRLSTMTMPFFPCKGRLGFFYVDYPLPDEECDKFIRPEQPC